MTTNPLDDFKNYLLKRGYSNSSAQSYVSSVDAFYQWAEHVGVADPVFATYADMLDYLKHLREKDVTSRTAQGYFIALGHYFDYLVHCQKTTTNPVRYLKIKTDQARTLYPILSRPQLEALYTNFENKPIRATKPSAIASTFRRKITVGFMVYQGLDTHALAQLTTEDLNLDKGTIHIPATRSHNERTLTLQSAQIMELYRYQAEIRSQLLAHFATDTNKLLVHGYTNYRDAHRRLIQRVKKQDTSIRSAQQIKASVITHWLRAYNLREVQYMAGHRNVISTEAYLRNDTEGLQLDIDRFHPLNKIAPGR